MEVFGRKNIQLNIEHHFVHLPQFLQLQDKLVCYQLKVVVNNIVSMHSQAASMHSAQKSC